MKHRILTKIIYVLVIVALCLSIAIPCFADSFGFDIYALACTPTRIIIYKNAVGASSQFYTFGNPYEYAYSAIQNTALDYSTVDYLYTAKNEQSSATYIRMRYRWSYFDNLNIQNNRVESAFFTAGNEYSLNYSETHPRALPIQYYYENIVVTETNAPIFTIYLTDDVSEYIVPHISYQTVLLNSDGKPYLNTVTKDVEFTVTDDPNNQGGSYIHTLSMIDIVPVGTIISAMYIDFPFENGTITTNYSDDFGFRVDMGFKDYNYTSEIRHLIETYDEENDFFSWVFNALESLFSYPLFYVYDTPITPFGVFSLVFGLALFAWFLKVFAGG